MLGLTEFDKGTDWLTDSQKHSASTDTGSLKTAIVWPQVTRAKEEDRCGSPCWVQGG